MRLGRVANLAALLIAALAAAAAAQTTLPATPDAALVVDLPAGWVKSSDAATLAGFRPRPGAVLKASFHPEGSRPTVVPYAVLEEIPAPADARKNGVFAAGEVVASYFRGAIDPPSRADRPGTWKSARVSKVSYEYDEFSLYASIEYVGGINGNTTYYVSVIGHYDPDGTTVFTTWTDEAGRTAHGPALQALTAKGLHPNIPPPPLRQAIVTAQERLVRIAKISGVLLILFVVGVQIFVLVRERKQRQAEEELLI